CGFANGFGGSKRNHAAEGEMKPEFESFFCLGAVSSETVHDAGTAPVFAEHRDRVSPGLAGMNDDGKIEFGRELQLASKDFALRFAWGKIVMVIEADLTEGYDLRVRAERAEIVERAWFEFCGIVRVNADGGEQLIMLFRKTDGAIDLRRPIAGADGE